MELHSLLIYSHYKIPSGVSTIQSLRVTFTVIILFFPLYFQGFLSSFIKMLAVKVPAITYKDFKILAVWKTGRKSQNPRMLEVVRNLWMSSCPPTQSGPARARCLYNSPDKIYQIWLFDSEVLIMYQCNEMTFYALEVCVVTSLHLWIKNSLWMTSLYLQRSHEFSFRNTSGGLWASQKSV